MIIPGLRYLLHSAVLFAEVQQGVRQHFQGPRAPVHISPGLHRADGQRVLHHRHRRRAVPGRHVPLLAKEVKLFQYRVTMVVEDLGWVDLDLGYVTILPSYPANSVRPEQNLTDSGMTKIISQPNPCP